MIPRVPALFGPVVALACGASCAFDSQRAWQERQVELLALAIPAPQERLPWELEFEALNERLFDSPRFDELLDSPHRANLAWSTGSPRSLDPLERQWVAELESELRGLEDILVSLRSLPLEELGWHGLACPKGLFLREITNALCARAWLALEDEDSAAAVRAWADALLLARALDDGTSMGTLLRGTSELIVLDAVRAGLALGASATLASAELLPFYRDWGNVATRGERAIRRSLSLIAGAEDEAWTDSPSQALESYRGVEEAIEEAHYPAREFFRADESGVQMVVANPWVFVTQQLHMLHARRNVAFTALAVAAWREQHGAFPETLADIDGLERELCLDPRTGAELPYERTGSRARVGPATGGMASNAETSTLDVWILR